LQSAQGKTVPDALCLRATSRPRLPHDLVKAVIAIVRDFRLVVGRNNKHLAAIEFDATNLDARSL
jgi:hypothetical protein